MLHAEIIRVGDPRLYLISEKITDSEFGSSDLITLSEALLTIMKENNGVGFAAPQIGINKRLIVFGLNNHSQEKSIPHIPDTVLINPSIIPLANELDEDYERCLSVGMLMGKVKRYRKIGYSGFNIHGQKIEREVKGLHARIIQHECDHLDGVIFLEKISDRKSYAFMEELKAQETLKS